MPRIYATPGDLATYMGSSAPADADALLAKATRFLDSAVFRLCWYATDGDGMPTNTVLADAMRDAVCAQAAWWNTLGDSVGAVGAGWGEVRIGSVMMRRPDSAIGVEAAPARQIAPEVWDVLLAPELTPDRLTIGLVIT